MAVGCLVNNLREQIGPACDLIGLLKASSRLFCDETRCPVLDPGAGKTKTGYLWAIALDDRPWAAGVDAAVPREHREAVRRRWPTLGRAQADSCAWQSSNDVAAQDRKEP